MRILTLLPDDSLGAIRGALRTRDSTAPYADVASLLAGAAEGRVDAVVLDPALVSDADWDRIRGVLEDPALPVLLYSALDTGTVKRVVAASAMGVHEVMLRGVDDDVPAVRRRLDTLRRPPPPARVLARLAGRLADLPPVLQGVTVPLFCEGRIPRWADDVAATTCVPRRSVDRWMERAGLAGTATLLDVARLARVWVPLVEGKRTPAEIAARGGYASARSLAVHARRVVGVSPLLLGVGISADEFVRRLALHALRG